MYNGPSNQTHARRARNKKAFDSVIDTYISMQDCSEIKAMDMSKDNSSTVNPAMPLPIDFCCDVDYALKCVLRDGKDLLNFFKTYILGSDQYTREQKAHIEQRLGHVFVERKLWPVNKYFITIKKRAKKDNGKSRKLLG